MWVIFAPEARQEFDEAARYYERQSRGLGGAVSFAPKSGSALPRIRIWSLSCPGEVVEAVTDELAHDDASPYGGLVNLIGDRIREYEARMHPWSSGGDSEGNGKAVGRFLERQGVDTVVKEEDPSLTGPCGPVEILPAHGHGLAP